MIYGAILAGGIGSRMKMANMPKQFLDLGDRPIIIHTIEKFLANLRFDKIYVAICKDWNGYLCDLLRKYKADDPRVFVIDGGRDRTETLMNTISAIEGNGPLGQDDIIVTHDAVRPFLTTRIIEENIESALKNGMCNTVFAAIDTIVVSDNGSHITDIPNRATMYLGQSPQSFNILKLKSHFEKLTPEQKSILTDACKICTLAGEKVDMIEGDVYNMKITTDGDYKLACAIYEIVSKDSTR